MCYIHYMKKSTLAIGIVTGMLLTGCGKDPKIETIKAGSFKYGTSPEVVQKHLNVFKAIDRTLVNATDLTAALNGDFDPEQTKTFGGERLRHRVHALCFDNGCTPEQAEWHLQVARFMKCSQSNRNLLTWIADENVPQRVVKAMHENGL